MAVALFALWASSDLQGMRGFSFGAGTAPRMFAGLLLALGFGVMLMGVLIEGAHIAQISLAWAALRLARDSLLCRHDPPAGSRALGLCQLHDRGDRFA